MAKLKFHCIWIAHSNHTARGCKTWGNQQSWSPTALGRRSEWLTMSGLCEGKWSLPCPETALLSDSVLGGHCMGFTLSQISCTHNGKTRTFHIQKGPPRWWDFSKNLGHRGQSEAVVTLERSVCAPWGRSEWERTVPPYRPVIDINFQLHFSVLPFEVIKISGGLMSRQKVI